MEKQTVTILFGLVIVLVIGVGFGYVISQNQTHPYLSAVNSTIKTNSTPLTSIAPNLNLPPSTSSISTSSSTTTINVTTTINYSNLTQVLSTLSSSRAVLPAPVDLGPTWFSWQNISVYGYSAVAVAVNTSIPIQLLVINSDDIASYGSAAHLMNDPIYYNHQVGSGIYELNLTSGDYSIIVSNEAESNTNGSGASVSFMPYVLMALNQT